MKRQSSTHECVFSNPTIAETYARKHQAMAEQFGREYARKLAARGFSRGRMLDVGCGSGAMNLALAARFTDSEFAGVDLSDPLLNLARATAAASGCGPRVRFDKANVQRLPYDDHSFDVVFNVNMLHLVDDPVKMLAEIERVLAPNGVLFIADLRRSWLGLLEREIQASLTLAEVRALLRRTALRPGKLMWGLLWWRYEA